MSRSWWRAMAVLPPLLLVVIPLALRPEAGGERAAPTAAHLVIIGPNNETIRSEFGQAFVRYARSQLHTEVVIDWRTPGGTTEIVKLIDEQFQAAFQAAHPELSVRERKAFNDPALDRPEQQPDDLRRVRSAFLSSDLGIGIDLMFGGGEFDHRVSLADKGYVVDVGLVAALPEVFRKEVIPQRLGSEIMYDPKGRYVGTALASFGICYSPDRLALLPGLHAPQTWSDLGDPRLVSAVAMADPSKSGSVAACYVMMLQEQIARAVHHGGTAAATATTSTTTAPATVAELDSGWQNGFTLIKRIAGNARYVTDSASRVAYDVARGDACAGMCIDFYGRSEAAWTRRESGHDRLVYVTPRGGTSISADPISCFRGAPHRELAVAFMRFVLSPEGQGLWDDRVGVPGGPRQYVLHRWPVRRDLYTPEHRRLMSDDLEDPFTLAEAFHAEPRWTGPYFDLIRLTIKAVVLDPRLELVAAWRAIIQAGGPEQVPEAYAALAWLPYARHEADDAKQALDAVKGDRIGTLRRWCIEAQDQYRRAQALAEAHR
jgi:ABC-type Fe3+ transport system substrate-binding protein